jgi:uncharacterized protein
VNNSRNVLGQELEVCCISPMTGFFRNGKCDTSPQDYGVHVVCAEITNEFLEFTKGKGNDLSTPLPAYGFPGLKAGDRWCLCATRWQESLDAGFAPPVILEATHEEVLNYIPLSILEEHSIVE